MSRPWRSFAIVVAAAVLPSLEVTKSYVLTPVIARALDLGPGAVQLMVSGYLVAFAVVLVPAGRFGDARSRRAAFLLGLGVFALASLAIGSAPDATVVVIGRLAQGVAGGILVPQTIGFIQSLFEGAPRAKAFGLLASTLGIAAMVGPVLAGFGVSLLGDDLGWRLAFLINVPIALIVGLLAFTVLPRAQPREGLRVDAGGAALFGLSVVLLFAPLWGEALGLWWVLGLAPLAIAGFLLWERRVSARGGRPLMDLELFRVRSFRTGVLSGVFYSAAMPGTVFLASLYVQSGLGLGALVASLVTTAPALAYALASLLSGALVYRMGVRLAVAGLLVFAIGLILSALFAALQVIEAAPIVLAATLVVVGLGSGWFGPSNQYLLMRDVPPDGGGLAGSMQQLGVRVGNAGGTALAAAAFAGAGGAVLGEQGRTAFVTGIGVLLLVVAAAVVVMLVGSRPLRR